MPVLPFLPRGRSNYRQLFDEGPDYESNAKENEGDAEELSHVKEHSLLEFHLRILYEFYEETSAEAADEEDSGDDSPVEFIFAEEIQRKEDYSKGKIERGLVQLRWMTGNGFPVPLEYKAPGKICGAAVNLRVEEIPEPYEAGGKGYRDNQMVYEPHEVEAVPLTIFIDIPY